jgi:tight adherence protein B
MRRSLASAVTLGALALLAVAAIAQAAQPTEAVELSRAGGEKFPRRALLVTPPGRRALSADQLTVVEDGEPVSDLELIPAAGGTARSFGTVIVMDASASMRGAPIEGAIDAARQLARQRSGSQQLGLVVFNRTSKLVLDLTADKAAIDRALASPPKLGPQTHVLDGVATALAALRRAGIAAGTIVVLSDGADNGSRTSVETVGRRARDSDVRIFSIGLRSGAFDPAELRRLTAAGNAGGRFAIADSVSDLRSIFGQIGSQLAGEYLIRYHSDARPGRDVRVGVRVDGIDEVATLTYRVPGDAGGPVVDSFWTSSNGVIATALVCALLLLVAFSLLLSRRRRGPDLGERVGAFVPESSRLPEPTGDELLTGRLRESTERGLERTRWWAGFKQDVEIAGIETEPVEIVTSTALVTLLVGAVLWLATGSPVPGIILAVIAVFAVRAVVRAKLRAQRRKFSEQLSDMLQGVASSLRAGQGLAGALAMVSEGAQEPSRTEFRRVVADERLGVPLDECLETMSKRMAIRDVQQVALVAELQRETGGNVAEVLDRIAATVRQRAELRQLVRGLTAQGRLSRTVVTALPVVLLGIIWLVNPGYVQPLFDTTAGRIMLIVAVAMLGAASLIINKIVDFEV